MVPPRLGGPGAGFADYAEVAMELGGIFRDARSGSPQPATSDVCADWLGAAAVGDDPKAGGTRW